jgi:serine acetyltransferase
VKNKLLFVRRKVVKFLSNFLIFKPLRREFIIIFSQKSGFFRRVKNSCQINNLMKLLRAGTKFPHPVGIVIAGDVKLGKKCCIYQNVTIGGKDDFRGRGKRPVIGDNVIAFSGSVIVGDISIGDNVIIAANSVVSKDVPSNSIVFGVNKFKKREDI